MVLQGNLPLLHKYAHLPNNTSSLPESEVKIGHKTGTSDKNDRGEYIGINDIGFVILPDGSRYVVAVFVKDSKENMETNAKIISDISAAVYRYAGNR